MHGDKVLTDIQSMTDSPTFSTLFSLQPVDRGMYLFANGM